MASWRGKFQGSESVHSEEPSPSGVALRCSGVLAGWISLPRSELVGAVQGSRCRAGCSDTTDEVRSILRERQALPLMSG